MHRPVIVTTFLQLIGSLLTVPAMLSIFDAANPCVFINSTNVTKTELVKPIETAKFSRAAKQQKVSL